MKRILASAMTAVLCASLVGCSSTASSSAKASQSSSSGYKAGTYTATADGHNGGVKVSVTFDDSSITNVEVVTQSETPTLSDKALEDIPKEIVDQQTLNVDNVSGATFTSNAIKNAVADAVDQAGGDSKALESAPYKAPVEATDDIDTDVLVIGGGTAGLTAAYEAAKAGAKTTLIEKLDIVGGTLNEAAGLLLTVDSEKNDPSLDDSLERVTTFYKNINQDSSIQPDYDFTSNLMSQTGKTVDELIDLDLNHIDMDTGSYVGTQFTIGYQLSKDLQDQCEKNGVTILTGTAADKLNVDDNGDVTGAEVHNDTGSFTITAKKTIVAAGGASWNLDMVPEKSTNIDVHEKTQIGSTGDGITMLKDIGAKISDHDPYIKSSQPDYAEAFHNDWSNTPSFAMTILIDADGKRFTNESLPATVVNKKMIDHDSSGYWILIDKNNNIGYDADFFSKVKELSKDDNAKVAVYADSLDDLADKLKVNADNLKATVDKYNTDINSGAEDEFGKDSVNYRKAYPDNGFYAVYQRVGSWGTIGGAYVDEQQRVLNTDGQPINNVFAAGETATAQLFGDYYFGGFSLGLYTTAGRIAAEEAVNEINQ